MKYFALFFLLLLPNFVRAQGEPTPGAVPALEEKTLSGPNLHFELQIISVPGAEVLPLVEALQDPRQVDAATKKLDAMLANGSADLVSLLLLITKSGDRGVVEDVDEIRYPVEFEAPKLTAHELVTDGKFADADPANPPPIKIVPAAERKPDAVQELVPMPVTFETRHAGTTLELEPHLDPKSQRIGVQLLAQRVFFTGMEKHKVASNRQEATVEQPRFEIQKVGTQITLSDAQRVLLGTFSSRRKEGWRDLFLLRGTIRQVPAK
jgi:hypothetical protein